MRLFTRVFTGLLVGGLMAGGASVAVAQTLADVARQEEERRRGLTNPPKVYTNKDLRGPVVGPPPSVAAAPSSDTPADGSKDGKPEAAKPASDAAKGPGAADASAKPDAATSDQVRDQAYWRERQRALQTALERDQTYLDALQSRINALTTEFVNRDDPAQRATIEANRQKALSELDRLRKQIEDDRKAIADLQSEARRAGVPPGWLR